MPTLITTEQKAYRNGQDFRSSSENPKDSLSPENLMPSSTNEASSPNPVLRRSSRTSKPRDLYYKARVNKNKELVAELDQQRGLDQPGTFNPTPEEKLRIKECANGYHVYYEILRLAGWDHKNNNINLAPHRHNSPEVFHAPGVKQQTGEEGVTLFYEYADIWHKWSSDEEFRNMIFNRIDPNIRAEVEANAPPLPNRTVGDYNRLGVPTLAVPVAARRPDESSTEAATETAEDQEAQVSSRKTKRAPPTCCSSKKQEKKRPKKTNWSSMQKSCSSTSVARGKTESPAPDTIASNGSSAVTSTSTSEQGNQNSFYRETTGSSLRGMIIAESQDTIVGPKKNREVARNLAASNATSLSEANETVADLKKQLEDSQSRLSEANNIIAGLKKQLEDSQNLADARNFEIEYLKNENGRLLQVKAKETVQFQREASNLKKKCEQLQEEMDRMRNNHAMEQGFF